MLTAVMNMHTEYIGSLAGAVPPVTKVRPEPPAEIITWTGCSQPTSLPDGADALVQPMVSLARDRSADRDGETLEDFLLRALL
jgi:hypothetical protein